MLDAAAARRAQAGESRPDLAGELALMQDDRSRLAQELDASVARQRRLAEANREVSARLGRIGGALALALEPAPGDDAGGAED